MSTRFERGTMQVVLPSALPAPSLAARAEALFASDLSVRGQYTQIEVAAAIRRAIDAHRGLRGCAGEVAAAYGEHPGSVDAAWGAFLGRRTREFL